MNSQFSTLDYLILTIATVFWAGLFGLFYHFAPNGWILFIGLIAIGVTWAGYFVARGMNEQPEAPARPSMVSDNDDSGWRRMRCAGSGKHA